MYHKLLSDMHLNMLLCYNVGINLAFIQSNVHLRVTHGYRGGEMCSPKYWAFNFFLMIEMESADSWYRAPFIGRV